MSYKVEELLALRDSVSESAVSIDRFADEDVIKEHVLRPSASASLVSCLPTKSFRPTVVPAPAPAIVAIPATNDLKKPSPSPSIKRGKAERLLKEHGSPPGMRVTAGGRVVPSDLQPLSSTRATNNGFRPQSFRSISPGNYMGPPPQLDVNNLAQVEVIGTQAVIRVGDRVFALPAISPTLPMSSAGGPGMDVNKQSIEPVRLPAQNATPANLIPVPMQTTSTQNSPTVHDLPSLQAQQSLKQQELKHVLQAEVWGQDTNGPAWRQQMISKKKSLILELDVLRKQIISAEESVKHTAEAGAGAGLHAPNGQTGAVPPAFVPQYQLPNTHAMYPGIGMPFGLPPTNSFTPVMMYQPFSAAQGLSADPPQFSRSGPPLSSAENANVHNVGAMIIPGVKAPSNLIEGVKSAQSPGSASRRSHAIEIKPPRDDAKRHIAQGSTLDPKSPTYEPVIQPAKEVENKRVANPPTPSPAKRSPWLSNEVPSAQSYKYETRSISQKASLSSIDTTDFFPTNTHEHSSTRIAPDKLSKHPSHDSIATPITPEKSWPVGPWNSQRSGNRPAPRTTIALDDSSKRLTSWPEAYGKQLSLSASSEKTKTELGTSSALNRKSSTQLTGASTDHNWPNLSSKPVPHAPFTYQEGYQAGLQHMGLPASYEFLAGFLDGLTGLLKEQRGGQGPPWSFLSGLKDGNRTSSGQSSLRDCLSGVTLNDSTVGLSENLRCAKPAVLSSSTCDRKGDAIRSPITYAFCNEAEQKPATRGHAAPKHHDVYVGKSPMTATSGKAEQTLNDMTQSDSVFGRQYSGNQFGHRTLNGTPAAAQRYYPSPKEYSPGGIAIEAPSVRSDNRQRYSGLDGAVDELAGLVMDTHLDEERNDVDASCFKASSGKGKQKAASSPTKKEVGDTEEGSSPVKSSGSPKKSSEHSPAKAKLEQVTNKLRRQKKEDPSTMSSEEKHKRTTKWRNRFQVMRNTESAEIEEYKRNHPRKKSGEDSRR